MPIDLKYRLTSDIDNDVDVDMIYVPIYIVESAVPGIDVASRHHDIVLFDSEAGGGLLRMS